MLMVVVADQPSVCSINICINCCIDNDQKLTKRFKIMPRLHDHPVSLRLIETWQAD